MIWSDLKDAPPPGTLLAALEDMPEKSTLTQMLGDFPLLLVRHQGLDVMAFVNLCPHQYLPLDHTAPAALSTDGHRLICSNHGACFDARTGNPAHGGWTRHALMPIPVSVDRGQITIRT